MTTRFTFFSGVIPLMTRNADTYFCMHFIDKGRDFSDVDPPGLIKKVFTFDEVKNQTHGLYLSSRQVNIREWLVVIDCTERHDGTF